MRDLDRHLALGRQEDDVVAVTEREVQLVDAGIVQNVIFVIIDQNIICIRDLGFLIGAEARLNAVAVIEHAVDKFRVPVAAGRWGDADGRNVAPAVVDQRNGNRHVLFAAAGQQHHAQRGRQQDKKQIPDFFHDSPPNLICGK